jgi:hypothetical protein
MALTFPASPVNGQIYDNYYWDEASGVWNSLGNYDIPNILSNGVFTASDQFTVPLTAKGATSQVAKLQEWKNSSDNVVASIDASGSLGLNTPLSVANGGIGTNSLTNGGYLKGSGTGAVTSQSGIPAGDITSGTISADRLPGTGFLHVTTLYFTSSGTFSKASYPWLRAIRIKVQGGGGGGAGRSASNRSGGGGGGGGYAERFFTDIGVLEASVTVTVGAGGNGGAAGENNGSVGGASRFGSAGNAWDTRATGGNGTNNFQDSEGGGIGTNGDLLIGGSGGGRGSGGSPEHPGTGGASFMGGGGAPARGSEGGRPGLNYGGGGGGASVVSTARSGGNGAPGIVIVELYA